MSFVKAIVLGAAFTAATVASASAFAGSESEALMQCFAKSTNKEEKRLLAKWFFFSTAAYSEVKSLATIPDVQREEVNKNAAKLAERLFGESCKDETEAALKLNDRTALTSGFGAFGKIAGEEFDSEKDVANSFVEFSKFMDKQLMAKLCGCHK